MTAKEAYEARKAMRARIRERKAVSQEERDLMLEDFFDRFAIAVKRIADALEDKG